MFSDQRGPRECKQPKDGVITDSEFDLTAFGLLDQRVLSVCFRLFIVAIGCPSERRPQKTVSCSSINMRRLPQFVRLCVCLSSCVSRLCVCASVRLVRLCVCASRVCASVRLCVCASRVCASRVLCVCVRLCLASRVCLASVRLCLASVSRLSVSPCECLRRLAQFMRRSSFKRV